MAIFFPPQDYVFFADESGISGDRFTVVGGICVHRNAIETITQNLAAFRERHNMHAELKWSKISDQKCEEYKTLVDYFFALNNQNKIHFHCIIFDSHQANHAKYNGGSRDDGLSKLYYQLILHKFAKTYGDKGDLCVCLDHRNSKTSFHELKNIVNNGCNSAFAMAHRPVRQLISLDSKQDDLLQLNDVILGAVCAARNGKHELATCRASKAEVARMVLDKSGLGTFDANSPQRVKRFTVWNMLLRAR